MESLPFFDRIFFRNLTHLHPFSFVILSNSPCWGCSKCFRFSTRSDCDLVRNNWVGYDYGRHGNGNTWDLCRTTSFEIRWLACWLRSVETYEKQFQEYIWIQKPANPTQLQESAFLSVIIIRCFDLCWNDSSRWEVKVRYVGLWMKENWNWGITFFAKELMHTYWF